MSKRLWLVWSFIVLAVVARLTLVFWAGNRPESPLSGGSDTLAYQTLANNIINHLGMTYAGEPTALRPPLYPLFLGFVQFVVGRPYRLVVRLIQLLAGIAIATVCAKTAQKLGGVGTIAFAAALAAPTLVFLSAEVLSETFAALIVAAFFSVIIGEAGPVAAGAIIGLGMIERFNLVALAVVYVVYQFTVNQRSQAAKQILLAGLVALAVVSPWFVRNLIVFRGQVLYSTHTGTNLLQGIITPDGRTQSGDTGKLEAAAGWAIWDIETNSLDRAAFPPEPQLDHKATKAALAQLGHVVLFPLVVRKLGYFWLSFDQLFRTHDLSRYNLLARVLGIVVYWFLLAIGIAGWRKVRVGNPGASLLFASYAVIVTAMHVPFVMNTRIRAPLIEPALAILAGCAFAASRSQVEESMHEPS